MAVGYRLMFSQRNKGTVYGGIFIGQNLQQVIVDGAAAIAVEVEESMIGKVAHCGLIGSSMVLHLHAVVGC